MLNRYDQTAVESTTVELTAAVATAPKQLALAVAVAVGQAMW